MEPARNKSPATARRSESPAVTGSGRFCRIGFRAITGVKDSRIRIRKNRFSNDLVRDVVNNFLSLFWGYCVIFVQPKEREDRAPVPLIQIPKLIKILRQNPCSYYIPLRVPRNTRINALCIGFIIFLLSFDLCAQSRNGIRTVVIDAGHGGHDPGALGRQSKEKNINLAIALKLGNLIQKNSADIRVIYTRDRDKFVELYRRAEIANKNKADLFISIHCNANKNKSLQGAETYVMGLHRSKANLDIAKLENASILLETDYEATYEGFDPNSDESYILFNLYQNANLERSTAFAALVQQEMTRRLGLVDRGVRQAGFLVLYKTTMPSVLVETGYISNTTDEKFLSSAQGQESIANAIFRAFRSFAAAGDTPSQEKSIAAGQEPAVDPTKPGKRTDSSTTVEESRHGSSPAKEVEPAPAGKEATHPPAGDSPEFRIQIATSDQKLPSSARIFSDFREVRYYRHGGLYKYTVGSYRNLAEAKTKLTKIRSAGYRDSFIVIFRNNERIPQAEADKIMRE